MLSRQQRGGRLLCRAWLLARSGRARDLEGHEGLRRLSSRGNFTTRSDGTNLTSLARNPCRYDARGRRLIRDWFLERTGESAAARSSMSCAPAMAPTRTGPYFVHERSIQARSRGIDETWYRIPDARDSRVMRPNLGRLSTFESPWEAWCDSIRVLQRPWGLASNLLGPLLRS